LLKSVSIPFLAFLENLILPASPEYYQNNVSSMR